jgi:hypothetical protein
VIVPVLSSGKILIQATRKTHANVRNLQMPLSQLDFRQTWLWKHAFTTQRSDATVDEQEFFRGQFLYMRERVGQLVSRIGQEIPGLTVHDITHLDSLWETASLVAEGAITVNPPEAFVFGAAVLLHDAAMTIVAYPGGLDEIRGTIEWKDTYARWVQISGKKDEQAFAQGVLNDAEKAVLPDVLRRRHAIQAAHLAEHGWEVKNGSTQYLIEDSSLRYFYGKTIGDIAHSHWWPVLKAESILKQDLGPYPARTRNTIDRVKLACLLRIADAMHLDLLRAPLLTRALAQPAGISEPHWTFQEKIARPHIELDAVVFTSGKPFERGDAEAWWLAYDTLEQVDRELRDVDLVLQTRGKSPLKARRVKGIGSPETLAQSVEPRGWRPVNARIKVSDVPKIVESLGGSKLYGDDKLVPLRELIQNAADAVQARRRLQDRGQNWGEIKVSFRNNKRGTWLSIEDNGIGMSEAVLTGPLLDFGTSFWRSALVMDEFPGLVASGMEAIGRFGIGFFSVFMLGDVVRVTTRRYDYGMETARVLEISGGPAGRPIIWPADAKEVPVDGGTRVEVLLKEDPSSAKGFLQKDTLPDQFYELRHVVAGLAPSLDVCLTGVEQDSPHIVAAGDWIRISDSELLERLDMNWDSHKISSRYANLLRPLQDASSQYFGRAAIVPERLNSQNYGWITISGLRSARLANVYGILTGIPITASRDSAVPNVPQEVLRDWATEQAELISRLSISDERKAMAAETVLCCGGNIGDLPILRWGGEWLSSDGFVSRLRNVDELIIHFDGEFDYDESVDEMHPREFRNDFVEVTDLVVVPQHNGRILQKGAIRWPEFENGTGSGWYRLRSLVQKLIGSVWGLDFKEFRAERVVGTAGGYEVKRSVTLFEKISTES